MYILILIKISLYSLYNLAIVIQYYIDATNLTNQQQHIYCIKEH